MTDLQMPVPPDFTDDRRLLIHSKVQARFDGQLPDLREQFSGGLGGVLYRITACAQHDDAFTSSVTNHGPGPPQPQRYEQERELYEFFVTGQSAVECLCYSLYALGAMLQPSIFDLFSKGKPHGITPEATVDRYHDGFGGDSLTGNLSSVVGSAEYKDWTGLRNVLTHRVHPGRAFGIGGGRPWAEWIGQSIDPNTTHSRRQWLVEQLNSLLKEADAFVDRLP